MALLMGCLFIYVVVAVFWAVSWYIQYDGYSDEYYDEEKRSPQGTSSSPR